MKLIFSFVIGDLFAPMKKIFQSALKDTGSQPALGRVLLLRRLKIYYRHPSAGWDPVSFVKRLKNFLLRHAKS